MSDQLQPCGHAARHIVSSDEGTSYCRECERIGVDEERNQRLLALFNKTRHEAKILVLESLKFDASTRQYINEGGERDRWKKTVEWIEDRIREENQKER